MIYTKFTFVQSYEYLLCKWRSFGLKYSLGIMNVLPSEWIHEDWNNDRTYDGASEVNSGQGVNLGRRRLEIALRDGLNARRVVIVRVVPDVTEATRFRAVVDAAREEEGLGRDRHVLLGLASDSKRCRIRKKSVASTFYNFVCSLTLPNGVYFIRLVI